jgi:hypothetical protein
MVNRKTKSPAVRINTRGLLAIEQMSKAMRHASAKANKCNAVGDCRNSPRHLLRYRIGAFRSCFLLACDQHAWAASDQSGIEITVNPG